VRHGLDYAAPVEVGLQVVRVASFEITSYIVSAILCQLRDQFWIPSLLRNLLDHFPWRVREQCFELIDPRQSRLIDSVEAMLSCNSALGLVGSGINVETGKWTDTTSHIGGGIDSYYEYLLKALEVVRG
jgi:hypothetical protein